MNTQLFCKLKPEDLLKMVQFSSALLDGFGDFENITLKALREIFSYTATSYSVWDYDESGEYRLIHVSSHFFSGQGLADYTNELWRHDSAYRSRDTERAKNAQMPLLIRRFYVSSENAFVQAMVRDGLGCQVIIGPTVTAAPPVHCLCVYKALHVEIDEYEHLLLSCLAEIFNEFVGRYKKHLRAQEVLALYKQQLDADLVGTAIYNRHKSILEYNSKFRRYGKRLCGKSQPADIIAYCMEQLQINESADLEGTTAAHIGDYQVSVDQGVVLGAADDMFSYYILRLSPLQEENRRSGKRNSQYSLHHLTSREIEVANCLLEGLVNAEISERLFISLPTVKTHVKNIYAKFGVSSRREFWDIMEAVRC